MSSSGASDFTNYLTQFRERVEQTNWILVKEEFGSDDFKEISVFFYEIKLILDLMQSMLEVGEDPPSITILGKKIINLNGVDLGESVQANVVNIRDTLEAGISILEGIQTQPFFPNFHKEIIVKIQKVVLHIDDLSRDLLARFQSYEIVLI